MLSSRDLTRSRSSKSTILALYANNISNYTQYTKERATCKLYLPHIHTLTMMFFNWTRWRALKTERVKTKELVAACVLLGVQHSTRAVSLCTTSAEYFVQEFWENLLVAAFMLLNVDNSTRAVSLCETPAEYLVGGLCWQIFLLRLVCYLVLKLAQLPYQLPYVLRRMNM